MTKSPVGWLPRNRDELRAQCSLIEYGTTLCVYEMAPPDTSNLVEYPGWAQVFFINSVSNGRTEHPLCLYGRLRLRKNCTFGMHTNKDIVATLGKILLEMLTSDRKLNKLCYGLFIKSLTVGGNMEMSWKHQFAIRVKSGTTLLIFSGIEDHAKKLPNKLDLANKSQVCGKFTILIMHSYWLSIPLLDYERWAWSWCWFLGSQPTGDISHKPGGW